MSQLKEFIERVDRSQQRCLPTTKTIAVPRDLLIAARNFIAEQRERLVKGGKATRGHRYQNVPESQLSQTPRAIAARARRRSRAAVHPEPLNE